MAAIAIDLGTIFVRVAEYRSDVCLLDRRQIIPNKVAFTDQKQLLLGEELEEQMGIDSPNIELEINRLMGRKHTTSELCPYDDSAPGVEYFLQNEQYTPENICSMLLKQLKEKTEERLKKEITSAVVIVPAVFNNERQEATRRACQLAGFSQVELLDEPTAAAWSAPKNLLTEGKILLIYDFGGGTLDVSIQKFECGAFKVLSSDGDPNLGGIDVDNRLVKYFCKKFEKDNQCSLQNEWKAITRLKRTCERLKVILSDRLHADVSIKNFYHGKDFKLSLSRAEFNNLNDELFIKTIEITNKVLCQAEMKTEAIDKVLMIGGSSLIPRVREKLEHIFGKEKVCCSIDPEWAVMRGVAKYTAYQTATSDVLRTTVNQLGQLSSTMCLKTNTGVIIASIKMNSVLPAHSIRYVRTRENNQTKMSMKAYEMAADSSGKEKRLGIIAISGIPPAGAGEKTVLIKTTIETNGMINVSAILEEDTGEKQKLSVKQLRDDE